MAKRIICTVIGVRLLSEKLRAPASQAIWGVNTITNATMKRRTAVARLKKLLTTLHNSARRSLLARSLNTGTSEELTISPPVIRLNSVMGTNAATVYAPSKSEVPNRFDFTISRTSPSTRLVTLPMAKTAAARTTPLFWLRLVGADGRSASSSGSGTGWLASSVASVELNKSDSLSV